MAPRGAFSSTIVPHESSGLSKLCNVCFDLSVQSRILGISYQARDSEDDALFGKDTRLRQEARYVADREGHNDSSEIYLHHETRKDLEKSAALGCHLCSLAANAVWMKTFELGGRKRREQDGEKGVGEGEGAKPTQEDDGNPESRNEDVEILRPDSPDVVDWHHTNIDPYDPDYVGEQVKGALGYTIKGGKWQPCVVDNEETTVAHESPAFKARAGLRKAVNKLKSRNWRNIFVRPDQSEEDFAVKSPTELAEAVYKLRSGIWCEISIRHGQSECRMIFKEYITPGYYKATDFTVVRFQTTPWYFSDIHSKSTDSASSVAISKYWIERCLQNHSKCRFRTFDLAALPSRLLEIDGTSNNIQIRLRDTSTIGVSVQYLTLSHCWGKSRTATLTSMTLRSYYEYIAIGDLPKTLNDAVVITIQLGFRYLWIDSLCIVQNSDADWKREAAKMGDIYKNATCSIAALGSRDSESGCFSRRDSSAYFPCRLGISYGPGLFVVPEPNKRAFNYVEGFFDHDRQPLWTRAWVFQEYALAPRTLNYDSRMLYWECIETRAWEPNPVRQSDDEQSDGEYVSIKHCIHRIRMLGERANAAPASEAARSLRAEWGNIVSTYSIGDMTQESDKLTALSGMTSLVQLYTGWSYLAGLWKPNLLHHLFWYSRARHPVTFAWEPGKRPSKYRAPTWSWASVEGKISWYYPAIDYSWVTEIIDAHVDLVDQAYLFSQVSGGYLRLRGSLHSKYTITEPKKMAKRSARVQIGKQFRFPSDGDLTFYQDTSCPCFIPCEICSEGITFLLVGQLIRAADPPLHRYTHAEIGLVLCPVKGKRNYFTRIGWFLEHLRQRESSFTRDSEVREITIV